MFKGSLYLLDIMIESKDRKRNPIDHMKVKFPPANNPISEGLNKKKMTPPILANKLCENLSEIIKNVDARNNTESTM